MARAPGLYPGCSHPLPDIAAMLLTAMLLTATRVGGGHEQRPVVDLLMVERGSLWWAG